MSNTTDEQLRSGAAEEPRFGLETWNVPSKYDASGPCGCASGVICDDHLRVGYKLNAEEIEYACQHGLTRFDFLALLPSVTK
jgi:hypothetical protein